MGTRSSGVDIPDWALFWLGAVLALAALVLLVLAARGAMRVSDPVRARVGNAIGYTGFAVMASVFAVLSFFEPEFDTGPIGVFLGGMVLVGVGGTMARWTRTGGGTPI